MKLTSEQKEVVNHKGNIAIESCPGSGKTRTVVAKLIRCLDEVSDTTRMVCCITYLNAAVHEINHRLASYIKHDELSENFEVGTIHSFCLNNIFHPNYWRIKTLKKGYEIISPDDELYKKLVNNIIRDYSLDSRAFDSFSFLHRGKEPSGKISQEAAEAFWKYLDTHSLVDFNDIIYYSSKLITKYKHVASGLASKFGWILVDEFQDTSSDQVKILKEIASFKRTKYFLVGDPYQSIMSFAGGDQVLMKKFSKAIDAEEGKKITGNFRSSEKIVHLAELVLPRRPTTKAVGVNKKYPYHPRWIDAESVIEGLETNFFPLVKKHKISLGECAILAPNFYLLLSLAPRLRNNGVPIIGPGARPYRRSNHIIAPLMEEVCLLIESLDVKLIRTIRNKIQDIFIICESKRNPRMYTLEGDIMITRIIYFAKKLKREFTNASEFIINLADYVGTLMFEYDFISKKSQKHIIDSGRAMIADIEEHLRSEKRSIEELQVKDLSLFSNNATSVKLLTLHRAKGREFDAVALINVQEYHLPHWSVTSGSANEDEARRLFYVGITRARKIIMMFTEKKNRKAPSRFLLELYPEGAHN